MSAIITGVTPQVDPVPEVDSVPEMDHVEEDFIKVIIRGHNFEVAKSSLRRAPQSKLTRIICGNKSADDTSSSTPSVPRFNRNPYVFNSILDYYSMGELHLPDGLCGRVIKQELEFWELGSHLVMPCCLAKLEAADQTIREVRHIQLAWRENVVGVGDKPTHAYHDDKVTCKTRVWMVINCPKSSCAAQVR